MAIRRVDIDNIKSGDILAKDVIVSNGIIVVPEDTKLKEEYIPRLKELGIYYVFIRQDDIEVSVDVAIEKKIQEQCKGIVRNTLDKYSYFGNVELKELEKVAEEIMEDILTEPGVMYNVCLVRESSESTYSHSINVSALSILLALKLKLNKKRVREIAIGSLLHDLGFVFISGDCLKTPYESLSEKQKKEIKNHVITGYSVVEKEKWLSPTAKEIILSHHERCDGGGYPMRLRGDRLKMEVKIVSVCDAFDSGVYGNFTKQLKVHEVIDYIVSQSGTGFDFNVVDVFVSSVAAYPIGTSVLTNEGEVGIVIKQNEKAPTRPIIRMLYDAKGNKYADLTEKDLTRELTLFIRDTF